MRKTEFFRRVRDAAIAAFLATGICVASAQVNNPGLQQSGAVVAGNCAKWGPGLGQLQDVGGPCAAAVTPSALTHGVNDTNVTLTLTGTPATALLQAVNATIGWTGTLAAGRLNANVVQGVTNDTNVTGSIAAQNLTLGWTGTLGLTRGGTGSGTQQGALNNISPTPTRAGDMVYYNGTNWVALAGNNVGTAVLQQTAAGVPSWVAAGSGTVTSAVIVGAGLTVNSGTCTITTTGTCTLTTTAAVKTDQTTGSSTAVAVVPAVQQNHDSAVKAWVQFAGATGTIAGSYNVTSVSRASLGIYTLNFTTAFANANYTCTGMAGSGASTGGIVIGPYNASPTTTAYNVAAVNFAGSLTDFAFTSVACYGRQ